MPRGVHGQAQVPGGGGSHGRMATQVQGEEGEGYPQIPCAHAHARPVRTKWLLRHQRIIVLSGPRVHTTRCMGA